MLIKLEAKKEPDKGVRQEKTHFALFPQVSVRTLIIFYSYTIFHSNIIKLTMLNNLIFFTLSFLIILINGFYKEFKATSRWILNLNSKHISRITIY